MAVEIKRYGKESNPEALISKEPKKLPYINGSMGNIKVNMFAPRGDHAKDAFDKELSDFLNDKFDF